jgi:uncharacterized protein
MLTPEYVQSLFAPFDPQTFFENHVADNVSWYIIGQDSPTSGHYTSKADVITKTFGRVVACLVPPIERNIKSVFVSGDWAYVEHTAHAKTKKGDEYFQEYCSVCRFEEGKIVEVRMYLDTALVKKVVEENE